MCKFFKECIDFFPIGRSKFAILIIRIKLFELVYVITLTGKLFTCKRNKVICIIQIISPSTLVVYAKFRTIPLCKLIKLFSGYASIVQAHIILSAILFNSIKRTVFSSIIIERKRIIKICVPLVVLFGNKAPLNFCEIFSIITLPHHLERSRIVTKMKITFRKITGILDYVFNSKFFKLHNNSSLFLFIFFPFFIIIQ